MMRWIVGVIFGCLWAVSASSAPLRGHLTFADGDRIAGDLVGDGTFVSPRFGEIHFKPGEATFEPAERPMTTAKSLRPDVEKPSPAPSQPAPPTWNFALSGYVDRTRDNGSRRREYFAEVRAERPAAGGNEFHSVANYEYIYRDNLIDKRRATSETEWRHEYRVNPPLESNHIDRIRLLFNPDF